MSPPWLRPFDCLKINITPCCEKSNRVEKIIFEGLQSACDCGIALGMASLRTDYNFDAALEVAALGKTTKHIAAALGLAESPQNLWRVCARYPQFADQLREARALGATIIAEDRVLTLVEDNREKPEENRMDHNELRLMAEGAKWYLSKLHSSIYGDKIAVQVENVNISQALEEAKKRTRIVNAQALPVEDPFA